MKTIITFFLLLTSTFALATDLEKIVGKYHYQQYKVKLADGRSLNLNQLGASAATLDINKDSTLVLNMQMLDGSTVTSRATINEVKINGNTGYWLAKWPDMNYSIRNDFSFNSAALRYISKFQNQSDPIRYGSTEEATLIKK